MSNFQQFTPFYGGIADIKYYGYAGKGQQALVENIDIISDPRVCKLPPLTSNGGGAQEVFAYTDNIRYCSNGDIVVDGLVATVGTKDWVNAVASNDTYYFVDEDGSVAKCLISNAGSAASFQSNTTTGLVSLTTSNIRAYPYLRSSSFITTGIYIGAKNTINLFSFSTETLSTELTLPGYIDVVGITEYGQVLNIYTRQGIIYYAQNAGTAGELVIVDSMDIGEGIYAVQNNGTFDYLICGRKNDTSITIPGESKFIIVSGRQKNIVKTEKINNDAVGGGDLELYTSVSNNFQMAYYNDLIFLPSNNGLYVYGKIWNGFPEQISHLYSKGMDTDGSTIIPINTMRSMQVYNGELQFSFRSGTPYRTNTIELGKFQESILAGDYSTPGTVVTYRFDAGDYTNPKTVKEIRVGAKIPSSTTIQLSYKIDDDANFTSISTLDDGNDGKSTRTMNRQFYKIQFKVVLTQSSGTSTPELFDLGIIYDIDKRKGS